LKYALPFFLLLCIAAPASAAPRTLTLEQAVAIALEKNRDIAKAGEYAKYVQGKYVEERSAVLPQLGLDAQTNLLKAQINRAKAATDYLVDRVNLDWTMGRLGE